MTTEAKPMTVRMRRETYVIFDALHQRLNETLPFGVVTKAELLDICVNSASAALAEGKLRIGESRERKDNRAA